MSLQTFALTPGRLNKFKGQILKHAVAQECLARGGTQINYDQNNSDTYVARRWLPYGATAASPNTFFGTASNTDRGAVIVQGHQVAEGITPSPDSITPQDVTVVQKQYSCLYGWTDKTAGLYEDGIPAAMKEQIGERVALVNELIVFGELKAGTNQFYGGTGTTRATVNGTITLPLIRKMTKSLKAQHGGMVTSVLKPSAMFGTEPVAGGYIVYASTDLEPDIRDLPGFRAAEAYSSGTPLPYEIGKCESFRFVLSPEFAPILDAATSVTAATYGLQTTGGTNPDVYQFVVAAKDAWSQVAVRGLSNLDPTVLPTGQKSKSDPHGQRGYAGTTWWKAVMRANEGWLAIGNVAAKAL
jgi:N4-gp56 family major capsid protein